MNEYDKECRSIRDKVENSKLYILLLLLMLYNLELFYSYLKYIEK